MELAVLADDLTGGMIVASMLEAAGVVCPLVTDAFGVKALPADTTATVLARKIRLIPADLAREEARHAAAAFVGRGARTIYYKYSAAFDSTRQGNIGPIAEALLEATGAERTVFCPAYVDIGITVYNGHLFFRSTLLAESNKRFDPVTPAYTSSVVTMLQNQTRSLVGLIEHQRLAAGAGKVQAFLESRADCPFWVADAIDDRDVDAIAALTRSWPVVTGGDSLPTAIIRDRLGARPKEAGSGRRLLPASPGHEALLAGSCGAATLEQLQAFEAVHPVWRVDLARDGDQPDLVQQILAWAEDRLASGPVGIATTANPQGVAAAHAAFGREGASARTDRLMSELAVGLFDLGVRKLIVAGGETSGAVLNALGVQRLQVAAYDDDLFGGYCHAASPTPVSLVLKPGGMGHPSIFFSALDRMRQAEQHAGQE